MITTNIKQGKVGIKSTQCNGYSVIEFTPVNFQDVQTYVALDDESADVTYQDLYDASVNKDLFKKMYED